MRSFLRQLLMAAVAALGCATAQAGAVGGSGMLPGMYAEGWARFCPGGLCGGDYVAQSEDGGPGATSASVAMPAPRPVGIDYAASAQVVGSLLVPELRAFASADTTDRYVVSTAARGMQLYNDTDGGQTQLQLLLTGTESGGDADINAYVNIWDRDTYFPGGGENGFYELRPAFSLFVPPLAQATLSIGGLTSTTLTFDRLAGQGFYVEAALFAGVDSRNSSPSIADARSTLALTFTPGSTGLVPVGVVPEPASWALLLGGLGLTGVAVLRRRRAG